MNRRSFLSKICGLIPFVGTLAVTGGSGASEGKPKKRSGTQSCENEWMHYVITGTNSTNNDIRIYLNGVEIKDGWTHCYSGMNDDGTGYVGVYGFVENGKVISETLTL